MFEPESTTILPASIKKKFNIDNVEITIVDGEVTHFVIDPLGEYISVGYPTIEKLKGLMRGFETAIAIMKQEGIE
jgi:hypothetical protein